MNKRSGRFLNKEVRVKTVILFCFLLSGCVTMTAAECKDQCYQKGMVMKGIVSTPTTAFSWARDNCICEPRENETR